jgi:hypothetical protein
MSLPCFRVLGEEQITSHHFVEGYTGLNIPSAINNKKTRMVIPEASLIGS